MTTEAFPLTWPAGYIRTKHPKYSRFGKHTLYQAREAVEDEVRMLRGKHLVISTNMKTRKDGGVYSNAKEPDDSGVAVYFNRGDRRLCVPCDTYRTVWENTWAIALTIRNLRAIERYGVPGFLDRAFTGFAQLPESTTDWRSVLGLHVENITWEDARKAYRELVKIRHPDAGGSDDMMAELNRAIDEARKELIV